MLEFGIVRVLRGGVTKAGRDDLWVQGALATVKTDMAQAIVSARFLSSTEGRVKIDKE